ncbi:MAG: anaerobic ribonucleoside-triphosphate reductase [Clostridia bacterium]
MVINTKGEAISQEEIDEYVKYVQDKNPDREIAELNLNVNGEFVDLSYTFLNDVPFERIRRITGYLVGTLDRFNDGKRAEEKDRVKHDVLL